MATQQKAQKVTLDDLMLGDDVVDDSQLAEALAGRVGVVQSTGDVRFQGAMKTAAAQKKIVAAGLARHVMQRKGLVSKDELGASSEWYANQAQQKPKTITEQLSRLKKAGLMGKNQSGWFVPAWALENAIEFLLEE